MTNEMKEITDNKPIEEKDEKPKMFYKINIIKANENNKNNDDKEKNNQPVLKSFRKLNVTKNILESSFRSKKSNLNTNNDEQIKKNIFSQVKKSNINTHHNKSKIFQEESFSPKLRQFNYNIDSNINSNNNTNKITKKESKVKYVYQYKNCQNIIK